ncbi:MAG: hypothetical protein AAF657_36515 [Acidobacteriota bacterium]
MRDNFGNILRRLGLAVLLLALAPWAGASESPSSAEATMDGERAVVETSVEPARSEELERSERVDPRQPIEKAERSEAIEISGFESLLFDQPVFASPEVDMGCGFPPPMPPPSCVCPCCECNRCWRSGGTLAKCTGY